MVIVILLSYITFEVKVIVIIAIIYYLRGFFALKVIVIIAIIYYLRGFALKVIVIIAIIYITFEVSPSRLLLLLPSRLRPQGFCKIFPSRFRPQGYWPLIGLAGASTFCLTWLVPAC